jgi:hypothetical protein
MYHGSDLLNAWFLFQRKEMCNLYGFKIKWVRLVALMGCKDVLTQLPRVTEYLGCAAPGTSLFCIACHTN